MNWLLLVQLKILDVELLLHWKIANWLTHLRYKVIRFIYSITWRYFRLDWDPSYSIKFKSSAFSLSSCQVVIHLLAASYFMLLGPKRASNVCFYPIFFSDAVNVLLESIDEIQFLQDTPWIRREVDSMRQVLASPRLRSLLTVSVWFVGLIYWGERISLAFGLLFFFVVFVPPISFAYSLFTSLSTFTHFACTS